MKFHLEQIKANDKFPGICLDFVDSGFVKTCDELVIGNGILLAFLEPDICLS